MIHLDLSEPSPSAPIVGSTWGHRLSMTQAWGESDRREEALSNFRGSFIRNLITHLEALPRRLGRIYERADFLGAYPGQRERLPTGTTHVFTAVVGTPITFHRPETLASFVKELVETQRDEITSSFKIDQQPIPDTPEGIRLPGLIVRDRWLDPPPYRAPVPVIEYALGEPFPYSLSHLVAMALMGTDEAASLRILSSWTFEKDGRQFLAIAVAA